MTANEGTIGAMIESAAAREGDRAALISAETGTTISYQSLPSRLAAVAGRLDQLGVGPGEPVGFLLDNGLFTAQLLLGAMASGRMVVPLSPAAGEDHLAHELGHTNVRIVFAAPAYLELCRGALARSGTDPLVVVADAECGPSTPSAAEPHVPATVRAEDTAALFYTSGTTGTPKGVMLSHRGLLAGAEGTVRSHGLEPTDRSLCVLPLYHLNALVATLLPALLSGGSVVLARRFDPASFWEWAARHCCTWVGLVPTVVSRLLLADGESRIGARPAHGMRVARCSSAPLESVEQQAFEERFGLPIIQAMGMTEAGATIFAQPLPPGTRKLGSVGVPVGFEARVVDPDGVDQAPGQSGELLVRGASVMRGYFRDPETTGEVLDRDGWLRTGDLGHRDGDGHFYITGRLKEIIVKAGVNIAPREIERVLERHPTVLEAAAVGIACPHLGQDLLTYVVPRAGSRWDPHDLQRFCQEEVGAFRTPTRILHASELPRSATGKILRAELARRAADVEPEAAPAGAEAQLADTISEIFAAVLGLPEVAPGADFFSLGGDSLQATRLIARLRDAVGVSLSLSLVFEAPTATALARRLDGRKAVG